SLFKSAIRNLQSAIGIIRNRHYALVRLLVPACAAAALLWAQYSFIRRLCAFLAAADIPPLFRRPAGAIALARDLRPGRSSRRSLPISSSMATFRASSASIANSTSLFAIVWFLIG